MFSFSSFLEEKEVKTKMNQKQSKTGKEMIKAKKKYKSFFSEEIEFLKFFVVFHELDLFFHFDGFFQVLVESIIFLHLDPLLDVQLVKKTQTLILFMHLCL